MSAPLRFPEPDDREAPPSDDARNLATFMAVVALLGAGVGLVFLVAMVLPDALYLILLGLALPLYFALHYVVWGRLMPRTSPTESTPDADTNEA